MGKLGLWQSIAEMLLDDIGQKKFKAGEKLPTELMLSKRFGVNRHTVRRALQHLAEKGIVWSKRGSGVYLKAPPTEYPIGTRVRFSQNLTLDGRLPTRKTLTLEIRAASIEERNALNVIDNGEVLAYSGISFADGQPIALFNSIFDPLRFGRLIERIKVNNSVTKSLNDCGITDYTRAWTKITAHLADPVKANHLQINDGQPLLCTTSLNIAPDGTPIEYGKTFFSAEHVVLSHSDDLSYS